MRKTRLVKWFSLAGAVFFGLTWALSLFFRMTYHWQDNGTGDHSIFVDQGSLHYLAMYGMCRGFGSSENPAPGWFYVEHHWPPTSLGLDLPCYVEDPPGASKNNGAGLFMLSIPMWFPFIGFAVLAGGSLFFKKRRPKGNQCAVCWYDLTGNESGICPECGTRIAANAVRRIAGFGDHEVTSSR